MQDLSEQLERLLAYAADCELIATFVADPDKRAALMRTAVDSREMVIARALADGAARHASALRLATRMRRGGVV